MAECPECGFRNSQQADHCAVCGLALSGDVPSRTPTAESGPEQPSRRALSGEARSDGQQDDWLARLLAATGDEASSADGPSLELGAERQLPVWLRGLVPDDLPDYAPTRTVQGAPVVHQALEPPEAEPVEMPSAVSASAEGAAEVSDAEAQTAESLPVQGPQPAGGAPAPHAGHLAEGDVERAETQARAGDLDTVQSAREQDVVPSPDGSVTDVHVPTAPRVPADAGVATGSEVDDGDFAQGELAVAETRPQAAGLVPVQPAQGLVEVAEPEAVVGDGTVSPTLNEPPDPGEGDEPEQEVAESAEAAQALRDILAAEATTAEAVLLADATGVVGSSGAIASYDEVGPAGASALDMSGSHSPLMPEIVDWPPRLGVAGPQGSDAPRTPADELAARARRVQEYLAASAESPPPGMAVVGEPSDRLLRVLVPLVLVVAIVLATALPQAFRAIVPAVSLPAGYPAGPARMHEALLQVAAGDDVLVAFEFGPALADELDLVAGPVVRLLMEQGARVSIVSTRPDGLVAARTVLREIVAREGVSGRDFRGQVEGAVASAAYRPGDRVGVAHLLQGAETPKLVVVFADRSGPLRWWVEQVHAMAGTMPVVAGSSASIEGVAAAYLSSDPPLLSGAVSGASGAAFFERIADGSTAGPAAQRLSALSAGNLAIVLLVIVGAAIAGWPAPRDGRGSRRR